MDIIKTSNEENERHGFLEIVVGPMYSGKTSRLMETYYKALSWFDSQTVYQNKI